MIKVIKKGVDPDKQIYKAVCPRCLCEFTFKGIDLKKEKVYTFLSVNGYIECPECGYYINKEDCINITNEI